MHQLTSEQRLLTEPPDLAAELKFLVLQIPRGRVTTFGDLAEALGDLQAARWVATELQGLDPDQFPVHRVIRRTGKMVSTPTLPLEVRQKRLHAESVPVKDDAVDLPFASWTEFIGTKPLELLRSLQKTVAERVTLSPLKQLPARVAGVDVSYGRDGMATAAYVVIETNSRKLVYHETVTANITFPYIPGYLSFRELPLYANLLQKIEAADRLEPWVVVDGNGILHPRRAGIACHLSALWSVITVGVSKHRLCGQVADERQAVSPIRGDDDTVLGYRIRRDSKRSILYVSPGSGVDVEGARRLVQSQLVGRRLPVPIEHADRISREVVRRL